MLTLLLSFAGCYALFYAGTRFLWWLLVNPVGIKITDLTPRYWPVFIVAFVLFFLPWLYLVGSLFAEKFLSINFSKLILYMGCTYFAAMWCEIIIDTLFVEFFGQPGWIYKIWPIHHGYTSGVGMFMWPLYGFSVYCLFGALETNPRLARLNNGAVKAYLLALDAMVL